jgi:hypothetical protein
MSKKSKMRVCVHCDKGTVHKDVACETCYEEMRQAMLDQITQRDLKIIALNTQLSLLQETMKNHAKAAAQTTSAETEQERKRA